MSQSRARPTVQLFSEVHDLNLREEDTEYSVMHFVKTSVSSERESIENLIRSGGGYLIARFIETGYVISEVDIVVVHQKQSRPSQLDMLKLVDGGN